MKRFTLTLTSLALSLVACATPEAQPSENLATRVVGWSQTVRFGDLEVTPLRIVEDSRCPTGVQCIQAGTVRIEARVETRSGANEQILALGVPTELDGVRTALIRACPYPVHGTRIPPGRYQFSLMFARPGAPALVYNQAC